MKKISISLLTLLLAPALFAGEPDTPVPPRRVPFERARIEDAPRLKFSAEALDATLKTITDSSAPIDKRVGAIAVAAMGRLTAAVGPLVAVIERPDDLDVKAACVWALREIGDPTAIPALLRMQALVVGPRPQLDYAKAVEFPDLGREMTLIELVEDTIGALGANIVSDYVRILATPSGSYLGVDNTINIQRSALAVLVLVGDRDHRAVQVMREILAAPQELYPADFNDAAALGLARILVARAEDFANVKGRDEASDDIAEALVTSILRMRPSGVREYLVRSLELARPEYTVTLLTQQFAENAPEPTRMRAIEILALMASPEATEALVWALENEQNPELRRRAAIGLGTTGPSKLAFEALSNALADEAVEVRRAALASIGKTAGEKGAELILPALNSEDASTRAEAAKALGAAKSTEAIEPLRMAIHDKDARVRASAVAALGAIPSRESLRALIEAASDENRDVRYVSAEVLSKIPAESAYCQLLRLGTDGDRAISAIAQRALKGAQAKHAAAFKRALVRVMTDSEHPASADACDMANYPEDNDIVAALRQATADKRAAVRASAIAKLKQLGADSR